MARVLILCTGNSCRSQMAEGLLKKLAPDWQIWSAGTQPVEMVHPLAVEVMAELGISIQEQKPKAVDLFLRYDIDFLITVCDHARETCPVFLGRVGERIHMGYPDPALAKGTREQRLQVFREVRDRMVDDFSRWYQQQVAHD